MPAVIAVFGLTIGSFANVLIARVDRLGSAVTGRSACPHCSHTLAWYDLLPVLSFIWLRGRCRYCHKTISWQYPVVELLTVLLALQIYAQFGFNWSGLIFFTIAYLLLVISVIDIQKQVIPDHYMLPALVLGVIYVALQPISWLSSLYGVLLSGGLFAFLVFASKERWMGAGDIGLAVLMGLLAGFPGVTVGLIFAFVAGSIAGLLLLIGQQKSLKSAIPFGPFLAAGIYLSTLWGEQIVQWYLQTIGFY